MIDYIGNGINNRKRKQKMSESSTSNSGIGFCGLLTILFIGLKLGSVIAWSWWWILSPLWIPVGLIILIGIIFFIFTGNSLKDID